MSLLLQELVISYLTTERSLVTPTSAQLKEEAGRAAWEAAFCSRNLSVVSGDTQQVTQRLTTAANELRRGGEGTAFAMELFRGEDNGRGDADSDDDGEVRLECKSRIYS